MTDFTLYTDGSGHQDGFGGFCATAICNIKGAECRQTTMGAATHTTVDRAEMTALLEGIDLIVGMTAALPGWKLANLKPTIHWFTDRQALALSVKGDYGRNSSKDLWARFAYYEQMFDITPEWTERENELPEFKLCDLHASSLRIVAKEYYNSNE